MAKGFSEIDLIDAKSFLRIDYDLDDVFIEMALESAKAGEEKKIAVLFGYRGL